MGADVVTLPPVKFRGKIGRPRIEIERRLVATKAEESIAELPSDDFLVGFEGPVEEAPIRLGREKTWPGGTGTCSPAVSAFILRFGRSTVNLPPAKPEGYPPSSSNHRCMSRFLASSTAILTFSKCAGER